MTAAEVTEPNVPTLLDVLEKLGAKTLEAKHLRAVNAELLAALAQCAAEWRSPPCTVSEGAVFLYQEFARRAEIAAAAIAKAVAA